jgi:hypothetical protein
LNCIDFRLRDEVTRFLNHNLHLQDDYDEMALPGASLAFVTEAKPHWTQTVDDVIGIATSADDIAKEPVAMKGCHCRSPCLAPRPFAAAVKRECLLPVRGAVPRETGIMPMGARRAWRIAERAAREQA